jgi:hypothetical protein
MPSWQDPSGGGLLSRIVNWKANNDYAQQMHAQNLAGAQLANQAQFLQNQQAAQQLQNADLTHKYWVGALQPDGGAAPSAPNQPAGAGALAAAGSGQSAKAPAAPQGAMSLTQLASLDSKYGLPTGTAYGMMSAESSGNPNAVSKKGAQGLFQVMPSTAADPGYGLKPFDPKDPDGAMRYFSMLYKQAGGDMSKALQMWNAGPKGNPNNPETQGFVPKVLKGMQQFAGAHGLDQAKQQPTPADHIAAQESAGVDVPVTAYQQATQAQGHQIQTMLRAAKAADQDGHPELAQNFYAQADKLQGSMADLQKKGLDAQKEANDETAKLAAGVKDQSSYDNFRAQVAQNPAMQVATRGLGLTGDYGTDQQKMQTLADRTMTLKDQGDLAIKQGELQVKQDQERRAQAKEDQAKAFTSQAQVADVARRNDLAGQGIPFAPSIAATAPPGTSPQQIQQAQQRVDAQNAAYDKANAPAMKAAREGADLAAKVYVALDTGAVSTGGWATTFADKHLGNWALSQNQQEFNKDTGQMVMEMAQAAGANGAARSTMTAAMNKIITQIKPNVTMDPEANKNVARQLYAGLAAQREMDKFIDQFRQSNPDATAQSGVLMWRRYEQAAGPSQIKDPATGKLVPNMAMIPTFEDGTPNTGYKDPKRFFMNGGKF